MGRGFRRCRNRVLQQRHPFWRGLRAVYFGRLGLAVCGGPIGPRVDRFKSSSCIAPMRARKRAGSWPTPHSVKFGWAAHLTHFSTNGPQVELNGSSRRRA